MGNEQGRKQRQMLQRQKPTRKRQKRRRRRRRPRRPRREKRRSQVMRGKVPQQQKLHLQEMVNLSKILLKRNQNLKPRVLRSQLWGRRRENLLTRKRMHKKMMLKSMLSCDNTYSETISYLKSMDSLDQEGREDILLLAISF